MSSLRLNQKYVAQINVKKGVVKVGCSEFPIEKIEALAKMIWYEKKKEEQRKHIEATRRRENAFRSQLPPVQSISARHQESRILQEWDQIPRFKFT